MAKRKNSFSIKDIPFVWVLGPVLVLVAFIIYFILTLDNWSKTEQPTSYTSEHFSFNFPPGYYTSVSDYDAVTVGKYKENGYIVPGVIVYANTVTDQTLEDFFNSRYNVGTNKLYYNLAKNNPPKKMQIDGIEAFEIVLD